MNCLTPRIVSRDHYKGDKLVSREFFFVPCGHCVNCFKQDQIDWAFRLTLESEVSLTSYFLTLTLDPAVYDDTALDKKSLQDFIKRLRDRVHYQYEKRNLNERYLKYFAVGEYGRKDNRAHYHLMVFNIPTYDKRQVLKLCQDCWQYGFVYVEDCCTSNCHYIAKYLQKCDPRDHVTEPFRTMSLKPALGYTWFEQHPEIISHIERTKIPVVRLRNGKCYKLPRNVKRKFISAETQFYFQKRFAFDMSNASPEWWQKVNDAYAAGRIQSEIGFKKIHDKFLKAN